MRHMQMTCKRVYTSVNLKTNLERCTNCRCSFLKDMLLPELKIKTSYQFPLIQASQWSFFLHLPFVGRRTSVCSSSQMCVEI